jgi:hypothetical protein
MLEREPNRIDAMKLLLRILFALLVATPLAWSQSFNVDIGANVVYGTPANSYGGGAAQPGLWNSWSGSQPKVLTSIDGTATAVTARYLINISFSEVETDLPGSSGGDERLMDDRRSSSTVFGAIEDVEISGLWNGQYEVYTYAFDSTFAYQTRVRVFGSPDPFVVLGYGTFPAAQAQNTTFAKHRATVSNGVITIEIDTATNWFSVINGFQLRWLAPLPSSYCTAKVNSLGCTPVVTTTGACSSSSASGFTIRCANARNLKPGLLLYTTNGQLATAFQGGFLCLASPIRRTPGVNSGGSPLPAADCSGIWQLDFNAFVAGSLGGNPSPALSVPGTVIDAQWWGRDPGFAPPDNTALSTGLEFVQGF